VVPGTRHALVHNDHVDGFYSSSLSDATTGRNTIGEAGFPKTFFYYDQFYRRASPIDHPIGASLIGSQLIGASLIGVLLTEIIQ
jgi:hypothetical protein